MLPRKRVTVLMHEAFIPPEKATWNELQEAPWKTEYCVVKTLKELGHDVCVLGLTDELKPLRENIENFQPHIVFNLLEEFKGEAIYDQNIVSYLEIKSVPYTGCNPRGLILARDKALSKKILSYHRIPVPKFQVFPKGKVVNRNKKLEFPLIVKSKEEESSMGISQASVVNDDEKLVERVSFIHESIGTDAIVEQFIEGREVYVGLLGNHRLTVLPVWELFFKAPPEGMKTIATSQVKHNNGYRKKHGINTDPAKNLSDSEIKSIQKLCKRVYRALNLDGYARIDLRLSQDGKPYFIEANPNPDLCEYEDFAMSADYGEMEYPELINRILSLGLSRFKGTP